jgi:hypothetical protein
VLESGARENMISTDRIEFAIVVRYADDMVLRFQHRGDAERFLQDWRGRLQKFGLELHPDKTRLIEFGRFAAASRKQRVEGKPATFNFLGFRIDGWWNLGGSIERFGHEPLVAGKDFGLKKKHFQASARRSVS